jgi:hypothetical protein
MRKLRPRNTIAIHISEGFGIWAIVPVYVFGKAKPSGLLFLGNRIDNDFAKRIARETGSQVFLATPEGVFAESYDSGVPKPSIPCWPGAASKRIGTSSIWTEQTTVLILTFQYASLTNSFAS